MCPFVKDEMGAMTSSEISKHVFEWEDGVKMVMSMEAEGIVVLLGAAKEPCTIGPCTENQWAAMADERFNDLQDFSDNPMFPTTAAWQDGPVLLYSLSTPE